VLILPVVRQVWDALAYLLKTLKPRHPNRAILIDTIEVLDRSI
jgi:hypothetical protein